MPSEDIRSWSTDELLEGVQNLVNVLWSRLPFDANADQSEYEPQIILDTLRQRITASPEARCPKVKVLQYDCNGCMIHAFCNAKRTSAMTTEVHNDCRRDEAPLPVESTCPNRAECGAPQDTKCHNGEWKRCRVRKANGWHKTPAPVTDDVSEWQKLGYFDHNDGWG